jgi:hypothetical protein
VRRFWVLLGMAGQHNDFAQRQLHYRAGV